MNNLNIKITDEHLERLGKLAEQAGLTSEDFLISRVESLLAQQDRAFRAALDTVLREDRELLERLAK